MNVAIVQFPGTNCEYDTQYAFGKLGCRAKIVWHQTAELPDKPDLVVIPGGFSYGDYLRSGAIARFSPIMHDVVRFAQDGGLVLGICNGFQILLESRLLPGAMKPNQSLHFVSKYQHLKVGNTDNRFLRHFKVGDILHVPIAHAEGNYYIDPEALAKLENNGQILLRYCNASGNADNPNGSVNDIAGICNFSRNVFGLMPHPERAIEPILGSDDGVKMLKGFLG